MDINDIPLALTYDDVLLVPQYSEVASRKLVDTSGRITRNITLKVPIVGANMDSVVGDERMCIALARLGGMAFVHRFLTIEEQCDIVRKVKRAESLIIEDPYTISPRAAATEAIAIFNKNGINGLPVVDHANKLLGLVTRRDLLSVKPEQSVEDVMTPMDRLTVASEVPTHEEAKEMMAARRVEKLPVVDGDGFLVGLITMKDIKYMKKFPLATKDASGRLMVGAAIGTKGDYIARAKALEEAGCDVLCLDIAHGHAKHAIDALKRLKEAVKTEIVAGNVATYEGVRDLVEAGADGVKVGVGPGSVCSTRIIAGIGVPQLSAVMESARAGRELDVPICADGGIRMPGDMSKAIAAGAETIMVGNLLAGTDESPGDLIKRAGRTVKVHRGMASEGATKARLEMEKKHQRGTIENPNPIVEHAITLDSQDEAGGTFGHTTAEGVEATVPYRGPVANVINDLVGGLRSAMSYSNSLNLGEYHERAKFVRITNAGLQESHPHDVDM